MVTNTRIADLIREARAEEIPEAIAEGSFFQMQTFSDALLDLVLDGRVERDVAANAASNKHDFEVALEHALKAHAANVRAQEDEAQRQVTAPQAIPELRVVRPAP